MANFLKAVAEKIYRDHIDDLADCCIVFPNRRAGLFFNKYLSELAAKPLWSPNVCTVSEFMQKLSGFQPADELNLIFELYNIYSAIRKSGEAFDNFYFWGEILLNDFDDIDKNLVNASHLFQNLADIREIEDHFDYLTEEQLEAIRSFWKTFSPKKYSVHQEDFISTWSVLAEIYHEFTQSLIKRETGYDGLICRQVAGMIDNGALPLKYSHYFFVGFNVLTKCEEKLFDHLMKAGAAEFYWDYDEHYVRETYHEAGHFLRANLKKYPPSGLSCSFSELRSPDKEIEIISAPTVLAQAKVCHRILNETGYNGNLSAEHTAIVLSDENLLMPVLYSLPPETGAINITMGYPLKNSPAYTLVMSLLELQKTAKKSGDGRWLFYHRNVLQLLNHPFINSGSDEGINQLISSISLNNKIYIPGEELRPNDLLSKIFRKMEDFSEVASYLLAVLHQVFSEIKTGRENENTRIQLEFVYHVYLSVKKLKSLLATWNMQPGFEICLRILEKILVNLRIPFTGEPLAGLQVMGILETRSLDFDHVIILSMNEGIFPSTGQMTSFIPQNIRKGFGLTTTEHRDAIFAYHFYRLIQRANKVFLLYNTHSDGLKSGEMSRYLYQLKYDKEYRVKEKNLYFDIGFSPAPEIKISKQEYILRKLEQFTDRSDSDLYLSPSAINTWLDCRLKFCFRYIYGISEPEEVMEDIDPMVFGNILHHCLSTIYAQFPDKKINAGGLEKAVADKNFIDECLLNALNNEFFGTSALVSKDDLSGRNILVFEVLHKYLLKILKTDISYSPFEIVDLEKKFLTTYQVNTGNRLTEVRTGGRIDRIDKVQNRIRIIDYKTGMAERRFIDIPSLFERENDKRNKAALQALIYSAIFNRCTGNTLPVEPGLYITGNLYGKSFDYRLEFKGDNKNYQPLNNY
ncbi:MAG: PD-(D/E)XK nuclease family protein, partial [Bacteroidia bacterium]|nr:PD-(D/E)XK nuclease family protein [Bacteroidia bacterium]